MLFAIHNNLHSEVNSFECVLSASSSGIGGGNVMKTCQEKAMNKGIKRKRERERVRKREDLQKKERKKEKSQWIGLSGHRQGISYAKCYPAISRPFIVHLLPSMYC